MSEYTIELITGGSGMIIGSYLTSKWLAFRTRTKRRARENALREIASHQWNNGTQNDAIAITRIALRGLKGE